MDLRHKLGHDSDNGGYLGTVWRVADGVSHEDIHGHRWSQHDVDLDSDAEGCRSGDRKPGVRRWGNGKGCLGQDTGQLPRHVDELLLVVLHRAEAAVLPNDVVRLPIQKRLRQMHHLWWHG